MGLLGKLSSSGKSLLVGLSVGVGSILGSYKTAKATDYVIDSSWMSNCGATGCSPVYINNILDDNPLTLGKPGSGLEDLILRPGSRLIFAPGRYELGLGQSWFQVRVSGTQTQPIIITGGGALPADTVLRGATPTSGMVMRTYGSHLTIKNLQTENAFAGFSIDHQAPYEDIAFEQINSVGHNRHYIWPEQNAAAPRSTPDVNFQNTYIVGGNIGFQFDEISGATLNTKYAGVRNATLRDIGVLGMNIPVVPGDNCIALGHDRLFNVVLQCSNRCANFLPNVPQQCFRTPAGYIEWELASPTLAALNVQPSNPVLPRNIEVDPKLSPNGSPMFTSPAIGQQYQPFGYAGAVPPLNKNIDGSTRQDFKFGDMNNDGIVNAKDISGFVDVMVNPDYLNSNPSYQRKLFAADVNDNNQHDSGDVSGFVNLLVSQ